MDKNLDENTKKVRKFSIWAGAFLLLLAVGGVVSEGIVFAARKAVFSILSEELTEIKTTTKNILYVVCEYHKSDKCPD